MKIAICRQKPVLSRDEHRAAFGRLESALYDYAECDFILEEGDSENAFTANVYPDEYCDENDALDWVFAATASLGGDFCVVSGPDLKNF